MTFAPLVQYSKHTRVAPQLQQVVKNVLADSRWNQYLTVAYRSQTCTV